MGSDEKQEIVSLTAEERAVLAEYDQALRDIQQQAQGAVRLMIRSRGLSGNWRIVDGQLVRAE